MLRGSDDFLEKPSCTKDTLPLRQLQHPSSQLKVDVAERHGRARSDFAEKLCLARSLRADNKNEPVVISRDIGDVLQDPFS